MRKEAAAHACLTLSQPFSCPSRPSLARALVDIASRVPSPYRNDARCEQSLQELRSGLASCSGGEVTGNSTIDYNGSSIHLVSATCPQSGSKKHSKIEERQYYDLCTELEGDSVTSKFFLRSSPISTKRRIHQGWHRITGFMKTPHPGFTKVMGVPHSFWGGCWRAD